MVLFLTKFLRFFSFIKFEHSIFALPFALSGALLVSKGLPGWTNILWIVVAMIGARSFAMSVNRILDKDIDSKNPRTSSREVPQNKITIFQAVIFSLISLLVFIYAALQLPRICILLLPIAALWFLIYPLTKRFTYLSHLWLGVALGASVLAGWLAAGGEISSCIPYILGAGVMFWVAGFDIIYACQDYSFDKDNKLHSIPSKFGVKNALLISKAFHILAVLFLVILGTIIDISYIYWISVIFVCGMLLFEQSLVKENDLSKVNLAFFTINGWVSIGFFVFLVLDRFFY